MPLLPICIRKLTCSHNKLTDIYLDEYINLEYLDCSSNLL